MIERLGDSALKRAILITTGLVIVASVCIALFGAGAQLTRTRSVTVVVRLWQLPPEVASQIHVGDPAFTDVARVLIGTITNVRSYPQPEITTDALGRVHVAGDPTTRRVDVTIAGTGRVGDGLVIVHTQAMLAGRPFSLLSDRYYLAGTLVSVDVR
jgi:hypothetical protein